MLAVMDPAQMFGHASLSAAADALEAYRARDPLFRGLSFPSISSADANAAVIHYAPHRKKGKGQNAVITAESLYLIDSGAQYLDGTTDVTRTVHLGTPTLHQRECFARVLKGFIAIHECVFPAGTLGAALDGLARGELWKSGLDFAHGVGHGVGSYLCVHEGPQAISCSTRGLTRPQVGFQRGMTVSDEPGYYEDGAFGIRIENILIARHAVTQHCWRGKEFLGFDSLTLVPLQLKMLDGGAFLNEDDIRFVNAYHQRVREELTVEVGESDTVFVARLNAATAPL
jgi:Xaa-Pro aminopeptidase